MPIQQIYFELRHVRPMQGRPWIPLRRATDISIDPPEPGIVRIEEFVEIATAAVDEAKRAAAEKLGWGDLDIKPHRSGVERWGYQAADIFRSWTEPLGINLVVDQHLEEEHRRIWHVHPDLIVALGLLLENDTWYRPEEGWVEVARLKRDKDREPVLLEIKAEFLADYLTARGMALYCWSYVERVAVTSSKPAYSWPDNGLNEEAGRDQREARTTESRFPDPAGHFWTRGCLWRTEWVAPGSLSVRVRGDKEPHTTSFALESDGSRKEADQLAGAMSWLYFAPILVSTLLRHRGARLSWYTQETGSLGATNFGIHFGLNDVGLITVYAKDIGRLPAWEQRLWSAHNVTPDGGISSELFAAQMEINPARTVAPEEELPGALEAIDAAFAAKYGARLLRDHGALTNLLHRAHRFRAAQVDGLLELSRELTRLFIERVDVDAIVTALALQKADRKPGSLKILEKLVTHLCSETAAKAMMAPLFGIYDLRLADAHLGSSQVDSGKARAGIDDTAPAAMQGRQLLRSFVDTLQQITAVLSQGG
jgi:hypothetical protein